MALTDEQGGQLVSLARSAVDRFTMGAEIKSGGTWEHPFLNEHRGAFVTLKEGNGDLRGCVGLPYPVKPLGDAVVHAAVSAAAYDPRFSRVMENELDHILVEVSALTAPERLAYGKATELPRLIRLGVDGLIVSAPGASGLLLPQVATELKLGAEEFLSDTCMKAGLMPDAWLTDKITVHRFQAEVFSETAPRSAAKREVA
jgi:uncharacterized protein